MDEDRTAWLRGADGRMVQVPLPPPTMRPHSLEDVVRELVEGDVDTAAAADPVVLLRALDVAQPLVRLARVARLAELYRLAVELAALDPTGAEPARRLQYVAEHAAAVGMTLPELADLLGGTPS